MGASCTRLQATHSMRLRDFGTGSGLMATIGGLIMDTLRRPWRILINLVAVIILSAMLLVACMARGKEGTVALLVWVIEQAEKMF